MSSINIHNSYIYLLEMHSYSTFAHAIIEFFVHKQWSFGNEVTKLDLEKIKICGDKQVYISHLCTVYVV